MHDEAFADYVAERLAALPGVIAVSLGGSRAQGTHRPDSDWDFAIYYRASFDPQSLRDVGWPGEVFEVGGPGQESLLETVDRSMDLCSRVVHDARLR